MSKPEIRLHSTTLGENLDAAEQALLAAGAPIFQAGGNLVQIVRLNHEVDAKVTRPPGALVIRPVRAQRVLELMLDSATFLGFDSKAWRPTAPSLNFVQAYLARGEWRLRVLRGIIEAPTLRPDGTVLATPGYDPQMQVYLDLGGVEFPAVPETPTREDALAALADLKDVISGFPFVPDNEFDDTSAARSVALSAMLTSVCRKALRTAPAHAIDAASPDTGKTLLCDTIAVLATGRPVVSVSAGRTKQELQARVFSVLLQGDPVLSIDNVDQELESDELCTVLTSEIWQNRVLGQSETRTVSTAVLVLINGNNLRFRGDLTTRVVSCRMDAGMENPGLRKFERDLRTYVPENRQRLVAAALTVLRAFVVAGRPGLDQLSAFERFADWSNLVRGALVWLGEPDPLLTREGVMAVDSEREDVAGLHRAWAEVIGFDKWATAREVIDATEQQPVPDLGIVGGALLDEALTALVGPMLTPKTLGRSLTQFDGRIVDGVRLVRHTTIGHSTRFRLERAQAG